MTQCNCALDLTSSDQLCPQCTEDLNQWLEEMEMEHLEELRSQASAWERENAA